MTENEKLDLILLEMRGMKLDIQDMKQDIQNMKLDIQNMKQNIQDIEQDIQNIKLDIENMKLDIENMKLDIENMKLDIENTKLDIENTKQDVQILDRKTSNIALHLENSTDKNIQLIAENFIELTKKLNQAIPAADNNLAYEVKVNHLAEEVDLLKKEVADIKSKIVMTAFPSAILLKAIVFLTVSQGDRNTKLIPNFQIINIYKRIRIHHLRQRHMIFAA